MERKRQVSAKTVSFSDLMGAEALRHTISVLNGIFGMRLNPEDMPLILVKPTKNNTMSYGLSSADSDTYASKAKGVITMLDGKRMLPFMLSHVYAAKATALHELPARAAARSSRLDNRNLAQGIGNLAYSCYLSTEKDELPFNMLLEHLSIEKGWEKRRGVQSQILGTMQWICDTAANYPLLSEMSKQWNTSMGDAYIAIMFDRISYTGRVYNGGADSVKGLLSTLIVSMSLRAALDRYPKLDLTRFISHMSTTPSYAYECIRTMSEERVSSFISEMATGISNLERL